MQRTHLVPTMAALCMLSAVVAAGPSTLPAGDDAGSAPLGAGAAPASTSRGPGGGWSTADLAAMDLEQLMQLDVGAGTLTRTTRQLVPAAVTTIDRDGIRQANPRSLMELLDIYVPNFQWVYHDYELPHMGLRGIINERDDKYLMLVNGRVMNERTHFGALTERDLPLLGDLRQVDVVRGPGSAVYGPGAVAMVINQQTESGLTYQGTEVMARAVAIDALYTLEVKHGERWSPTSGMFLYAGIAQQPGADRDDSPIIQGQDFDSNYGQARHGVAVPWDYADNNRAFKDHQPIKLYAQIDGDGITAWARYTRGGASLPPLDRGPFAPFPTGWNGTKGSPYFGAGYQQLTAFAGIKRDLGKHFELDVNTSFDVTEFQRIIGGSYNDSYREQKWLNQAILRWSPNEQHQVAVGVDYAYYQFGLPAWSNPGGPAVISAFGSNPTPEWYAYMLSFVGEYQWRISPQWTTVVSARADKHRFTDWLFSPRAAVAWTPDDRDTVKLIGSRSLRTNIDEEMKLDWDKNGQSTDPETLKSVELRYERQQGKYLFLAGSVFYNDLDVLGANATGGGRSVLGACRTIGAELEATYRTGTTTITASQSYVKLLNFNLQPGVSTFLSAAPNGYGNDLADWSNFSTKLTAHQQINKQWSVDGSIRVYWGFQGDKDMLAYKNANPFFGPGTPASSVKGWDKPFGISSFLNLGAEYKITPNAAVRLDAYNILGWADGTLNKRGALGSLWAGSYREEAPAVGVTLRLDF